MVIKKLPRANNNVFNGKNFHSKNVPYAMILKIDHLVYLSLINCLKFTVSKKLNVETNFITRKLSFLSQKSSQFNDFKS